MTTCEQLTGTESTRGPRAEALATRQQVAEHLAINLRTLDRLIADGALTAHRVGQRRVRIPWAAVDRYLERNTVPSSVRAPSGGVNPWRTR
jgi:excisionase family DNA binding protein